MREKDLEQAILLEEKVALHATCLLQSGAQNVHEPDGVEAFMSNFGSYKELITDDCDTVEISQRVFHTVQEISQLASNLYKAATGYELPTRSFSSVGERQSEVYQSPKLPTRAETFSGFDDRRIKQSLQQQQLQLLHQQQAAPFQCRDALISTINSTISLHRDNHQEKRDSYSSETDTVSLASTVGTPLHHSSTSDSQVLSHRLSQDPNYEALQVSHHLHTLLCIINQQMTTIASLNAQLNAIRENPKTVYRHNDQMEELRNLHDKFQEDKTTWLKQKEHQEKELEEQRLSQEALQKQIRAEQEDIRQQREGLYRKMEKLSSQGLLLSPNVALPPTNIVCSDEAGHHGQTHHSSVDDHTDTGSAGTAERRKNNNWRSATSKCHFFGYCCFVQLTNNLQKYLSIF